ncbi:hypothetical protein GGI42DRAFT_337123 [Trichoderma sp. SZMC 28013]
MSFATPSFVQPGIRPTMPQQQKNAHQTYQSRYNQFQQPQQHPSAPHVHHQQSKLHQPPLQRPNRSIGKMLDAWIEPKLTRIGNGIYEKIDGVTNDVDEIRRTMEDIGQNIDHNNQKNDKMGQNCEAMRQEIVYVTQKIDELSKTSRNCETKLNELKTIVENTKEFMVSLSEVNTILQKINGQEAQAKVRKTGKKKGSKNDVFPLRRSKRLQENQRAVIRSRRK